MLERLNLNDDNVIKAGTNEKELMDKALASDFRPMSPEEIIRSFGSAAYIISTPLFDENEHLYDGLYKLDNMRHFYGTEKDGQTLGDLSKGYPLESRLLSFAATYDAIVFVGCTPPESFRQKMQEFEEMVGIPPKAQIVITDGKAFVDMINGMSKQITITGQGKELSEEEKRMNDRLPSAMEVVS